MKFIGKKVLILPDDPTRLTSSSLIIVDRSVKKPDKGKVIKVGNLVTSISAGDYVVYDPKHAYNYEYEGRMHVIVDMSHPSDPILLKLVHED